MSYVLIASVAVAGPPVLFAALTQLIPWRHWRLGYRPRPDRTPPGCGSRAGDGFARRLRSVLSGHTVSGAEKGDAFQLVHTEPLRELPTDYVDPNWGWIVRNSARARRDREIAAELTPLLWRTARGMGLDRRTAQRVVVRAVADSALGVPDRDAAELRAVLLAAVQRAAAQLAVPAADIESDPLAAAPRNYRRALTVLAYGHPEDTAPLLENLGAPGNAALAWWRAEQ